MRAISYRNTERISRAVILFNAQICSINSRLQAVSADWGNQPRYQYLGIDASIATEIQNRANHWSSDLFPKYQNPLTKDSVDGSRGPVQLFIRDFRQLANPVLDRIAASDHANYDDEIAFNLVLKKNRKGPSRPTVPIDATCSLSLHHLGARAFRCQVRKPSDAIGRANIPRNEGVDQVELAYFIVERSAGQVPNINPDSIRTRVFFTRAIFDFHVGTEFSACHMIVFARWINSRYPHFAGPWSEAKIVVIA